MVRQRKYVTQLVAAIDELALTVRIGGDPEKVTRSWLSLDRNLLGGVDTGVAFFATQTESEQMRAVLAACVTRITGQAAWDQSWKVLELAEVKVADWDDEECHSGLLAYLTESRRRFAPLVDTGS
jgi:hypothetical protein